MSDIGDDFRALREYRKEKRKRNKTNSTDLLKQHSIDFEEQNNGVHLIIRHNDKTLDFYPSTGLWWDRDNRYRQRRGVFPLLRYIGVEIKAQCPKPKHEGIVIIDDNLPF